MSSLPGAAVGVVDPAPGARDNPGVARRRLDPIRVVEAAYSLAGSERDWLAGLLEAARGGLDFGLGCGGATLVLQRSGPVRFEAFAGVGPSTPVSCDDTASLGVLLQDPDVMAMLARTPFAFASVSETLGSRLDVLASTLGPGPSRDVVGLLAQDGEGRAVDLFAFCAARTRTTPRQRELWKRIGVHCAAGLRLRRNLARVPEAILTPNGDVANADGPAREPSLRDALRAAVRRREVAIGPERRRDPARALELWQGLVAGRWSLVDRWEDGATRYVTAIPNAPDVLDPRGLTRREAEVVNYAARGASNKEIAYALGVRISSVGSALAGAMRKLGVQRRAQLPALVGGMRAEVSELRLGGQELRVIGARSEAPEEGVLSTAEAAVVGGLLRGETDRCIATRRGTSIRTVQNQVRSIFRKLGVRSRGELASKLAEGLPGVRRGEPIGPLEASEPRLAWGEVHSVP